MSSQLYDKVVQTFRSRFQRMPDIVARAPGRVNLIGEHTDYNDGFVLPIAVDRATWIAAGIHAEYEATIRAIDMRNDEAVFRVDRVPTSNGGWADYPMAIVWAFLEAGKRPFGLDAAFTSDVPVGAGMSSSAAVEIAFSFVWSKLSGMGYPPEKLALLSQRAENQYVGVNCGIMDQMISACGKADHAMLLDTRTLERRYFPMPKEATVVVADSLVRRQLATSEYNIRRAQCEDAVRRLKAFKPEIRALRDVTAEELAQWESSLPETVARRARHVVHENARVFAMAEALQKSDLAAAGELMKEGHRSLRDDYQVSSAELDTLVEAAIEVPGCYGARLTGAGFGGCIVALADESAVQDIRTHLIEIYEARYEQQPNVYIVHSADGVSQV